MSTTPLLAATLPLLATLLPPSPPPAAVPPPPIVAPFPRDRVEPLILALTPAPAATCAGGPAPFARAEVPPPRPSVRLPNQSTPADADRVLAFDIAADGRPLSIAPVGTPAADPAVQAALAGSRFEPRARTACRVTYAAKAYAPDTLPLELLARLLAPTPPPGPLPAQLRRLLAPGDDCRSPPEPRVLHFIDPDRVPREPGSFGTATLRFDVNADGSTANIRSIAASENPAMQAEAERAVAASRFAPKARRGCPVGFALPGPTLPAPATPNFPDDPCKGLPRPAGARLGATESFPPDFRRRAVEGWARLRYDVDAGGRVIRTEVVAAQPASAFGDAAERDLRTARLPEGAAPPEGAKGCEVTVRYRMETD